MKHNNGRYPTFFKATQGLCAFNDQNRQGAKNRDRQNITTKTKSKINQSGREVTKVYEKSSGIFLNIYVGI